MGGGGGGGGWWRGRSDGDRDSLASGCVASVEHGMETAWGNWQRHSKASAPFSAQDVVALGKTHARSVPSLCRFPKIALITAPMLI